MSKGQKDATPEQVAAVMLVLEEHSPEWIKEVALADLAKVPFRTTQDAIARLRALGTLVASSSEGVRLARSEQEALDTALSLRGRAGRILAAAEGMEKRVARLREKVEVAA